MWVYTKPLRRWFASALVVSAVVLYHLADPMVARFQVSSVSSQVASSSGADELQERGYARLPAGEHTFTHAEFPGYDDPSTSVLRMVDNPHTLVQRGQTEPSTLSYMHAPAVVQYYAVWHAEEAKLAAAQAAAAAASPSSAASEASANVKPDGDAASQQPVQPEAQLWPSGSHGMLDLSWYIVKRFDPLQLASLILHGEGDSSERFLSAILQPKSVLHRLEVSGDIGSNHAYASVAGALRAHGPGLVSQFHVFDDFRRLDQHKHHTPPEPEGVDASEDIWATGSSLKERHAMALVGARVDADGRAFFLLQNWWAGKQFVEVSEEYLRAADARLSFVETPQTGAAPGLRTGLHSPRVRYAETEAALVMPDQVPLERVKD